MTIRAIGRSLELFFIDGRPDGMLTDEVFNWTGHVLMTPRTQIGEALTKRKEAHYTGIYLLGSARRTANRSGTLVRRKTLGTASAIMIAAKTGGTPESSSLLLQILWTRPM